MFTTIITFVTGKLGPWILLAGAGVAIYFLVIRLKAADASAGQKDQALKNANFSLDTTRTKNGQLAASLTTLQVTTDEFAAMNKGVAAQIAGMGLKLSQLQDVTDVIASQRLSIASIPSTRDTSKKAADTGRFSAPAGSYITNYRDKWATFTADISLIPNRNPYLTNVNISLADSIILAHTTLRKRVWLFFHKVIGVQTHITSNSPYMKIDSVEDYRINR
jgi:hypothetical protein